MTYDALDSENIRLEELLKAEIKNWKGLIVVSCEALTKSSC